MISGENHFSKWPVFKKKMKKVGYIIWDYIKDSGKKLYLVLIRSYRNPVTST